MKTIILVFVGVAVVLLASAVLFTAGWNAPPVHTVQAGFRGLAFGQLSTPNSERLLKSANALPDPIDPAPAGGQKATQVYKNVQVLTDLSAEQFDRVMLGLAAWVGGETGCVYCHNPDNLADDSLYTKKVSRVMLKLTRHVNKDWQGHVAATGVTCYTCHRGQPVPANIWFKGAPPAVGGAAANNNGFGHPNAVNGSTSMSTDPFSGYFDGNNSLRVVGTHALPVNFGASVQKAEQTYSTMIAISKGLGVNCTFCHFSRSFTDWDQSPPQRVTAWHGIQLVRDLNDNYLTPLKALLPDNRLGPTGDAPKVNCGTCHQGVNKPLFGASLAKDWPELSGVPAK